MSNESKIEWRLIGAVVGAAVIVSAFLYGLAGKLMSGDFAIKLADFVLQGAIITLLFATVAKGVGVMLTKQAEAIAAALREAARAAGHANPGQRPLGSLVKPEEGH